MLYGSNYYYYRTIIAWYMPLHACIIKKIHACSLMQPVATW